MIILVIIWPCYNSDREIWGFLVCTDLCQSTTRSPPKKTENRDGRVHISKNHTEKTMFFWSIVSYDLIDNQYIQRKDKTNII